jgi:hypothetical protein
MNTLNSCRAEAAASQEAAEAERAAKFVLEAEAQATQSVLERMQSSLDAERSMATKVSSLYSLLCVILGILLCSAKT